jgi:predicted lipoprotein with Yx(FWY)xxD motif
MKFRGPLSLFTSLAIGALVLAACGSSSSNSSSSNTTTSTAAATTTTAGGSTSGSAASFTASLQSTGLGKTLVDSQGRTLYVFKSDSTGKSNCNAGCDGTWPPYKVTGAIKLGPGLDMEDFKTITRSDGSTQLTDYGMPVYMFSGDTKAGDTNGDGIANLWYAVGEDSKPAAGSKLASSTSATTAAPATTTTALPGY